MFYEYKIKGEGPQENLGRQLQKLARGCRQGSIATRRRYISAFERFIVFISKEFKLQKLSNVSDKHLIAYGKQLLMEEKSHKYIKTELSAIRALHSQMSNTRHILGNAQKVNKEIGLLSTPDGRARRSWTEQEFLGMVRIAEISGKKEISGVLHACRYMGLRLDEACTLRRYQIEQALRTAVLYLVNTKGGKPRSVPLNQNAVDFFSNYIKSVKRGQYLFIPDDYIDKIQKFKKEVQKFIINNRFIQDPDRSPTGHNIKPFEKSALTCHGLRHTALSIRYENLRESTDEDTARKIVSREAGHYRKEVTKIYTVSIDDRKNDQKDKD